MTLILTIANQKGGVGKTTTSVNLAAALSQLGKRTLLVDLDPQGNATMGSGIDKRRLSLSVYDVLIGEATVTEARQRSDAGGYYQLPANREVNPRGSSNVGEEPGPSGHFNRIIVVGPKYSAFVSV